MEKRKLNLNKIRLYCLLNNVGNSLKVPSCVNCQYAKIPFSYSEKCNHGDKVKFFVDEEARRFSTERELNKDKKSHYEPWYWEYVCDNWKKRK